MNYKFKCSKCGGDRIEEIMTDVVMSTTVSDIYVDDNGEVFVEYSENEFSTDGGVVDRYQCVTCGKEVSEKELKKLAKKID